MSRVIDSRMVHEKIVEFEDGEYFFQEGDTSRDLFIIQEGQAEILKRTELGEIKLTTFVRGEFFGDMALLQGGIRFAGARAVGKTTVLVLQPGGFLLKIKRDPTFAFEMLQALSLRIKVSNERLIDTIKKGNIPKDKVDEILAVISGR